MMGHPEGLLYCKPAVAASLLPPVPGDLERYLQSVLGNGLQLKPPQDGLMQADGVTSLVLHRDGQYQVELIIFAPGAQVPSHTHADVDSYEVGLSGAIAFVVAGQQVGFFRAPRSDGVSRDFGRYVPIAHDAEHSGVASAQGACFLSVQRWRDGVSPTHVGLNWSGASSGPEHQVARDVWA